MINLNINYFNDILSRANRIFTGESMQDSGSGDATGLMVAIERAKEEMQYAENYFESVSDPDLIDHAIYYREAARKKYAYLLKLAKKEGLIKAE
ncbi:MAG: YaaL family protein [Thermoanaerobacteraceae bacterium]|nr:YaaL family protein [Thermoanaerobacteraceae bacterium]